MFTFHCSCLRFSKLSGYLTSKKGLGEKNFIPLMLFQIMFQMIFNDDITVDISDDDNDDNDDNYDDNANNDNNDYNDISYNNDNERVYPNNVCLL